LNTIKFFRYISFKITGHILCRECTRNFKLHKSYCLFNFLSLQSEFLTCSRNPDNLSDYKLLKSLGLMHV